MPEPPASLGAAPGMAQGNALCCWRIDLEALASDCPGEDCERWHASEWLDAGELARLQGFALRKRRIEWLGGRLAAKHALRLLLARVTPPAAPPASTWPIVNDEEGRPEFHGLPLYVSITHSRRLAMAAVGAMPVGVDLEGFEALRARSLEALLRPAEVRVVQQALPGPPEAARAYLWCLKEALFKAMGEGSFARFAAALHLAGWQAPDRPLWRAGPDGGALPAQAAGANRWRALCAADAGTAHVLVLPA